MAQSLAISTLVLGLILAISTTDAANQKFPPPGMNPDIFPEPTYDSNAPKCSTNEPCGFYSFSLNGRSPLKWIQSWCRCRSDHDCTYARTDFKMRLYRMTCKSRAKASDEDGFTNRVIGYYE